MFFTMGVEISIFRPDGRKKIKIKCRGMAGSKTCTCAFASFMQTTMVLLRTRTDGDELQSIISVSLAYHF